VVEQLLDNGFDPDSKGVLQRAAWRGHLKCVQLLLDFGANIESIDSNKNSALVCACQAGRVEVVQELLSRGANPNAIAPEHPSMAGRSNEEIIKLLLQYGADPNAKDVMSRMAWDGNFESIQVLLAYGAKVDAVDCNKKSPLVCACDTNRPNIVTELLKHGANPNLAAVESPLMAGRGSEEIIMALLQYGADPNTKDVSARMAWDGNFESLKMLIDSGCQIDTHDLNKVSPLHAAAERGRTEIVKFLLDRRANPNFLAPDSCLMAGRSQPDSIKVLLDYGADPNTKDVLTRAAWDNCFDTVRHMLDHGADVNDRDLNKTTPLHAACERGYPELVKLLLDRHADPNLPGPEPPLMAARCNGEVTHLLLTYGANPFTPDVLQRAAWDDGGESVAHLLAAGADINAKDKNKHTALWAAVERDRESLALILLDRGADPNLMVVLPKAAGNGNLTVVRRLLDAGAWINAKNEEGVTALQAAASQGKNEVLQFLLNYGPSS
jgi:ankyrin repeat protein